MASEQFLFMALFLVIFISGAYAKSPQKLINGTDASNITYQVSIQMDGGRHICGGSIIHERFILTAANCVQTSDGSRRLQNGRAVIGTNNRFDTEPMTIFRIVDVKVHEDYEPNNRLRNDIAIIKVNRDITVSEHRKPLLLPSNDTPVNTLVTVSGWGVTNYSGGFHNQPVKYLQEFSSRVISNDDCQKVYTTDTIYDEHICAWAGGRSALCSYDSGAPLIDGSVLVGVASFNEYCNPAYPDVYTRVYNYVSWIQNAIDKLL